MAPIAPPRVRTAALIALLAQAGIVLTGAAVRLTSSGLGCENWPACTEDRLVPEWGFHHWVEFGNRLLSFVVIATVVAVIVASRRRQPHRTDLVRWSWGLALGVAAQVVVGGVSVLWDLHPVFVGAHYLLSVVLLWNAMVLWVRASTGGPATGPGVGPSLVTHARVMVFLALFVLVMGTVVTGTGPNGGDDRADRLALDLTEVARIHAVAVWVFVATIVALALRLHRQPAGVGSGARVSGAGGSGLGSGLGSGAEWPSALGARASRLLIAASVAQGAVGYTQYAMGIPPALVELHIVGSVVVWCTTVWLYLVLFHRPPLEGMGGTREPVGAGAGDDFDVEEVSAAWGVATMET